LAASRSLEAQAFEVPRLPLSKAARRQTVSEAIARVINPASSSAVLPSQVLPSGAVLAVRDVSFAYGAHRVLDDISLTFNAGAIHVLMGPNGAGKSSLVRLLAGSRKPLSGTISGLAIGRRAIGLVPQEIALYTWLTARENCRAFGRVFGLDRHAARERAEKVLRLTQCDAVADTPVRQLSGGFQRRVNIAAALVGDPLFLILDEPTAGVDLAARAAIAQTIETLRAAGTSVLMVTHDFAEADRLADHVAFLVDGRIVKQGEPRALVADAFGTAKRIEMSFVTPPVEAQRRLLAELGAQPIGQSATFVAYRAVDGWNVNQMADELAAHGLKVAELRLRNPGLECLYERLCGQAGTA
jgi:ABC-2 type transport system ATP-binding protein